jgi:hypothetical protein
MHVESACKSNDIIYVMYCITLPSQWFLAPANSTRDIEKTAYGVLHVYTSTSPLCQRYVIHTLCFYPGVGCKMFYADKTQLFAVH